MGKHRQASTRNKNKSEKRLALKKKKDMQTAHGKDGRAVDLTEGWDEHRCSMERVHLMYPRIVMTPKGIFFAPAESEERRSARFERAFRDHQATAVPVHPAARVVDELLVAEADEFLHRARVGVSRTSCIRRPNDESSGGSVSWKSLEDDGKGKLERVSVLFFKKAKPGERDSLFYSLDWLRHQVVFSNEGLMAIEED